MNMKKKYDKILLLEERLKTPWHNAYMYIMKKKVKTINTRFYP